jgi:predicted Zn-dependent peptidase
MSDLTTFKLANGISVYLQEERTDNQVAIEAVYRAGYTRDPKGKVQLAHLTEHMAMYCASGPYKAGETMNLVKEHGGMIAAEAVADFIHVDAWWMQRWMKLAIEASRLKGSPATGRRR